MEQMGTTTNPNGAAGVRKEGHMAPFESEVREFAREFPTPNVERAVALCEAGRLNWADVAELFRRSLAEGMREVAA